MKIQRLTIDCNGFEGTLCRYAGEFGADKGVLNTSVRDGARKPHRHAYTPVYQLLFATRRFARLRIAEIGIETGAGLQMLRAYFPHADLFGFERHSAHIQTCEALGLPGFVSLPIDVSQAASITAAFQSAQGCFDIVIDDATHRPQDQARVITGVYPFLKPGGTLIIEDIFENAAEETFEDAVASLELDFAAFVFPEHRALSRGWKNDKLLILVKRGESMGAIRNDEREEHNEQYDSQPVHTSVQGRKFNTDWRLLFKYDYASFDHLDFTNTADVFGKRLFVIFDGQLYAPPSIRQMYTGRQWGDYLQTVLSQWSGSGGQARVHLPTPPDVAVSFAFVDACKTRVAPGLRFFPSKIPESLAPVWFDWFHVAWLNQNTTGAVARQADRFHTELLPVWRGTAHFLRIPQQHQHSRSAVVEYLRTNERLHLVDFSTRHPDLLDARLSGLKTKAQTQAHWTYPEVESQTQWLAFDPIDPSLYYSQYQNVVVVDGIGPAFRLINHFQNGQTVILQKSRYLQYFYRYMIPWVHYVPLATDLRDLEPQLSWVRDNPKRCREIGENGRDFFEAFLSWQPSLDLSVKILTALGKAQAPVDHLQLINEFGLQPYKKNT